MTDLGKPRMKRGPFGVWFSLALAILVLGVWVGWKLGARIAAYSYRSRQQKIGTLSTTQRRHIESVSSDLSAAQAVQLLYVAVAFHDKKLGKEYLSAQIAGLEARRHQSDAPEIRPVLDLDLGLAYVDAAMAEERDNNKELAAQHMKSAQALFQSLGWQDYSEETLRAVAQREIDRWSVHTQAREHLK
jgi:hypothetical protein